jgi:hypothetical protein
MEIMLPAAPKVNLRAPVIFLPVITVMLRVLINLPEKKRKLVKTKRATLAKLPEISTSSSIVNKSTQESNIGGDIVKELCL